MGVSIKGNGFGQCRQSFLSRLPYAGHDAGTDGGDSDALELVVHRQFETNQDEVLERPVQIVDHEDDALEGATMSGGSLDVDAFTVVEWGELRELTVEHVAGDARDSTVDATEPHAARVDGGDQSIGVHLGDVAFDHRYLSHWSP